MSGQMPGVKLDLELVLIPVGIHLFDYSDKFYFAVFGIFCALLKNKKTRFYNRKISHGVIIGGSPMSPTSAWVKVSQAMS
jgi:hypothetical protein